MIPDDEVDRVLDAADIVTVIGERVKLKRVGNSWRGPCPFHHGKGDNFSVMPGRGYRCWVCGETGSVFTYVQKELGMDFVEAVKYVGQKFGVEVREVSRRVEGPDPREPLWEVVAAALAYFQKVLWSEDEGTAGREYLAKRGIQRDVADRFFLGFAPRPVGALRRHLETLGFGVERQIAAGLLKQEEGKEPRPRFRGRLIFPIHDPRGHPVGFGGRAIEPDQEPKYINSAESAIYSKGSLLYHLHEARYAIRKAERVLVVEGYFDAVRTAASGIEEVVAPLGTALTTEQAKMLKRYTPNVFLLYDSDKAGLKATFRAGDALLREGASVRVVTLPEGEDPDTFVARFGAAGLEKEIHASVDVFERKLQLLQRMGWFGDISRARKAIDKLLPTIRAAADQVTRDLYLTRAAQMSGVDRETLVREAAAAPARRPADEAPSPQPERPRPRTQGGRRQLPGPGVEAERSLVRAMLLAPNRMEEITEALGRIDDEALAVSPDIRPGLREPSMRAIHTALLAAGDDHDVARLSERLSPEDNVALEELLANKDSIVDLDATIDDSLAMLKVRWRTERIAALRAASGERDPAQVHAEVLTLKKEIDAVGRRA